MKVLYRLSDRLFSRDVLLRIQAALDAAARYERMPVIQQINVEFSALDAKAAALISHLSVMVAAISFLHGAAEAYWLNIRYEQKRSQPERSWNRSLFQRRAISPNPFNGVL